MSAGDQPSEVRYVAVGDADVAYRVFGEGPPLLYFWGLGSNVELQWDHPLSEKVFTRLASFSRLIFFDRRGTGASDGVPRTAIPTWEEWTEDIGAVLDAIGVDSAAIFAEVDAGPIAALFAAMHPKRVSALVLANTSARMLAADDYPVGLTPEQVESLVEVLGSQWGTTDLVELAFPDIVDDRDLVRWIARVMRASATPRTAAAQYRYITETMDVREALPLIQAPTLVLHHTDNPIIPLSHARYLADQIDDARLVEISGADAELTPARMDEWVNAIAEFVTGERPSVEVDRVLTTVLFTDICSSTERAAALGDRRWRTLLDNHDRAVRDQLRRFRGHEIKTTGDGFLVSFDGPARAIRCAKAIASAVLDLGIEVRAGLHTGECEVRGDDLGGLAVHIAARVGALAGTSEVLASGTVKDLVVGSEIGFADRGEHELKGVPGTWRLYAVEG